MNVEAAITFARSTGNPVEQARLQYVLDGSIPPPEVRLQLFAGQREDGGWSPFWAPNYSSLDATCFRLAQAQQLGISTADAAVQRALALLAHRQRPDGSWEEDAEVADLAPHWVTPGVLEARLYLSANCGFWLTVWADSREHAGRAANHLRGYQEDGGQMPGFVPTQWLCGGLWYSLQRWEEAESAFSAIASRLADLHASNLTWLLSTLLLAGVQLDHPLIQQAASRLEKLQEPDGHWSSEDGPAQDVHTTLEALHTIQLCRRD